MITPVTAAQNFLLVILCFHHFHLVPPKNVLNQLNKIVIAPLETNIASITFHIFSVLSFLVRLFFRLLHYFYSK